MWEISVVRAVRQFAVREEDFVHLYCESLCLINTLRWCSVSGCACIWTQFHSGGGDMHRVCLQTVNTQEKTSWRHLFCLLQVSAVLYWCRTSWRSLACDFQYLLCTTMFLFEMWGSVKCYSRTSLFGHGGLGHGSCVPGHNCFYTSFVTCLSTQKPCKHFF